MWRYLVFGAVMVAVVVFGFSLIDVGGSDISANAVLTVNEEDLSAYARAIEVWDWQFPRDHGMHPEFQTEWWYYTGNVATEEGRRFGYQFTIFRRALAPQPVSSESEWRSTNIFMAHFTVSDLQNEDFYHEERYSREGAGLAGALPVMGDETTYTENYRVWLEDWQVHALDASHERFQISAQSDGFGVDVLLDLAKPISFQGINGLSPKSDEPGNASYYYSMTRHETSGTISIGDEAFAVSGHTWMDHEFSTSALGDDALGWDWFGLIFDDQREMTVGIIRKTDGSNDLAYGGLISYPDGQFYILKHDDFSIEATGSWESPHTGAVYPSGWVITVNGEALPDGEGFRIEVTPMAEDQELSGGDLAYWEGAVRISGDTSGYGYAELTGYADTLNGRF